jgi:hypothetical protein
MTDDTLASQIAADWLRESTISQLAEYTGSY